MPGSGREETASDVAGRAAPADAHPITIAPAEGRVVVRVCETVVAETTRALELREAGYSPVLYVPLGDVDPRRLARSDRRTVCPYKGDASYYGIVLDDRVLPDAVWTYEDPYDAVAAIAGHVAFYADRVTIDRGPAPADVAPSSHAP